MDSASLAWAKAEFGRAELGDIRRTARLVAMGAAACERPSGKVAAVFGKDRTREGAYDFLENDDVDASEIMASVAAATMTRAADLPFVFVPIDGTSITVTDEGGERDFGSVGRKGYGARGLKIIDALAVDPEGTVVGWLALTFWRRDLQPVATPSEDRSVDEKETRYWIGTVQAADAVLQERGKRGWFQIDREGDGKDLLRALSETRHLWTVRSRHDRSIELEDGTPARLRAEMEARGSHFTYDLAVPGRPGRAARTARMVVRIAQHVVLKMAGETRLSRLSINVVWAREEGPTAPKEKPIDWLLYTNYGVETAADAQQVLQGYAYRWRVEECHRTWKSGECDVESTQLHSFEAVRRWAIILGAIATRIERLKGLARRSSQLPATIDCAAVEIEALRILRSETYRDVPEHPTIGEVVAWLAELGGWTNKYSKKPPGAVVIGRGLRYLRPAARLLAIQGARDRSIP